MVDMGELGATLDNIFSPPTDIMIDPSLLVASNSLEQLPDSALLSSQTQATLTRIPTESRVGDVHIPSTFERLVSDDEAQDVPSTSLWNFYRGQADTSSPKAVRELLSQNDITAYGTSTDSREFSRLDLGQESGDNQSTQLKQTLTEVLTFISEGGILLARRPMSITTSRDAGIPLLDLGQASLNPRIEETLENVGYDTPVSMCCFGVSDTASVSDALVGSLTEGHPELILYRHSR
jgi:hypothetical protein